MALSSKAEKAQKEKDNNAGKGKKDDDWTWKGTGKRISQGEKNFL